MPTKLKTCEFHVLVPS